MKYCFNYRIINHHKYWVLCIDGVDCYHYYWCRHMIYPTTYVHNLVRKIPLATTSLIAILGLPRGMKASTTGLYYKLDLFFLVLLLPYQLYSPHISVVALLQRYFSLDCLQGWIVRDE